jgi:hypothetical protein
MPALHLVMDIDENGSPIDPASVVHTTLDMTVGTLRAGMQSGKDSVMLVIPLPDGRNVIAETSAELFVAAGRAITAWQEGRRARGES